jgi:hypothetical protein
MKHQSLTYAVVAAAVSLGAFAGCYTKLMPFRDAVATRQASVIQNHPGNFTSDLNYRENCLSCHSEAELNDRAGEMDYAGIHNVHGLAYDPYGWQNPYSQPTWWEPYAPIQIGVAVGSAKQPVLIKNPAGTAAPTGSQSNAERRRATGTTRGTDRTREANPTGTITPTPASTTPATPVGQSGPGAVTTIPPPHTTPAPAATPATDERTRSSGTEESKTRKTGSGRE